MFLVWNVKSTSICKNNFFRNLSHFCKVLLSNQSQRCKTNSITILCFWYQKKRYKIHNFVPLTLWYILLYYYSAPPPPYIQRKKQANNVNLTIRSLAWMQSENFISSKKYTIAKKSTNVSLCKMSIKCSKIGAWECNFPPF